LVARFENIWKIDLDEIVCAKVTPLVLKLKPSAFPKRAKNRRYSREHAKFIAEMCSRLEKAGCIRKNPNARWSSPVYVVKKPKGGYRMTIDVRYPNSQIIPIAGVMPMFETELAKLSGCRYFSTLDALKGYWQFPLAEESQEIMSFQTDTTVYTPTRLIQGGTDSVFAFQNGMREVLGDLLSKCCSVWIDDILQYGKDSDELIENLEAIFERVEKSCVFLNPDKSELCMESVTWCGRNIDKDGVTFDDTMVSGLMGIRRPENVQELQKFICACNWMRSSIPDFTKLIHPLQDLLLNYTKKANSCKGNVLKKITIVDWNQTHEKCFNDVKDSIRNLTKLNHYDPSKNLCLFTDASQYYWGVILSQISDDDVHKKFEDQKHEPLCFLSGKFSSSQLHWSTIEKECYPIIIALNRLKHFLMNLNGFRLFTDHKNLVYLFNPGDVKKPTSERLCRWTDLLSGFRYVVEHIDGISNVWADILSRWNKKDDPILASISAFAPSIDEDFVWPTIEEILEAQEKSHDAANLHESLKFDMSDKLFKLNGKIWIPSSDLQLRIMIIAHCSSSGHRGIDVTLKKIKDHFWWGDMDEDVENFVRSCLHCLVNLKKIIPRPMGEQLHAAEPNQILHYDFLYINLKNKIFLYILVLKDDLSNYVQLIPCKSCDHFIVVDALVEWYSRFGHAKVHISDNGTHFKNKVIKELHRVTDTKHHFVTAYCPWANGSVEVVNDIILKLLRSLLSEYKMKPEEWPRLVPLIQGVINHTPSKRLAGLAPITVFTGLPANNCFGYIFDNKEDKFRNSRLSENELILLHEDLSYALADIHRTVDQTKKHVRELARKSRNSRNLIVKINFEVGDYVLIASAIRKDKLSPKWTGPYRVVDTVNEYVYVVENLLDKEKKTVHAMRMMFYKDSLLNIDVDIKNHLVFQKSDKFDIEKILNDRIVDGKKELSIQWLGFEEATWEPEEVIAEDVPKMVEDYYSKKRISNQN
jgi:hypothetical protein